MRYILTILSVLLLTSCLSYRIETRQPELRNVLGVTTEGDTIQVPMDYFGDRVTPQYNYDIEYFFWRDSWWLYNQNFHSNRWWWYNQPVWIGRPNNIFIPRYNSPRQRPQRYQSPTRNNPRSTPRVQPNRGRSNQTIRQPQYVRPQTQSRSNSNSRTTSGGRVIKQ
jgi:hypothetical protein